MLLSHINDASLLFESKGWEIEQGKSSLFNRFIGMISRLDNDKHVDMIIELSNKFLRIKQDEYSNLIKECFTRFVKENNSFKRICVLPLLSKQDAINNAIKSSYHVAYIFKGNYLKYIDDLDGTELQVYDKPNLIRKYNCEEDYILLVDDFIGTGDTAIDAVEYIMDSGCNFNYNNFGILSIATMKTGLDSLMNYGIKIYTCKVIDKGITDIEEAEVRTLYTEYMELIEKKLKVKDNEKFGYKRSEALISLARTPNNTFPIYRHENQKKHILAPFPRH